MRKAIMVALSVGLLAASLSLPAQAKKAKPVATKLFFHGSEPLGEIEFASSPAVPTMKMDAKAGDSEKSMQLINYVGGPNTNCAGNNLFPVWVGNLSGTVKGDVKVFFETMSTPGKVDVRIWPDVAGIACDDSYIEPAGHVVVDLNPNGMNEAVIKGVNFKATSVLMVQLTPVLPTEGGTPFLGRVFYDAGPDSARVEFKCTPASGTSCTP